jgi:hypothetical protein
MKISSDTIGNRTRYLQTCSAVRQPTARLSNVVKDRGPHLHRSGNLSHASVLIVTASVFFAERAENGYDGAEAVLSPFVYQHLCSTLGKPNHISVNCSDVFRCKLTPSSGGQG